MTIFDINFSPDLSPSLILADIDNYTATIWDIAVHKKVQSLGHGMQVFTAKYSPQGDWVVIASDESVQVWDSDNGHLCISRCENGTGTNVCTALVQQPQYLSTHSRFCDTKFMCMDYIECWIVRPNGNEIVHT